MHPELEMILKSDTPVLCLIEVTCTMDRHKIEQCKTNKEHLNSVLRQSKRNPKIYGGIATWTPPVFREYMDGVDFVLFHHSIPMRTIPGIYRREPKSGRESELLQKIASAGITNNPEVREDVLQYISIRDNDSSRRGKIAELLSGLILEKHNPVLQTKVTYTPAYLSFNGYKVNGDNDGELDIVFGFHHSNDYLAFMHSIEKDKSVRLYREF